MIERNEQVRVPALVMGLYVSHVNNNKMRRRFLIWFLHLL